MCFLSNFVNIIISHFFTFSAYIDHCKDRTRLRGLQTEAKAKVDNIMALINESNPLIAVDEGHLKTGKFPWYEEETTASYETRKNGT